MTARSDAPARAPRARRVLVTGASGMIGRHAVAELAARGDEVHAVSRGAAPIVARGVTWHTADLLADGVARALAREVRATHWLHFAWNTTPGRYWHAADNLDWVAASLALFRAFGDAGGERTVLAGTCAEYRWGDAVLAESSPIAPHTLYGAAKNALRECVEAASPLTGVSVAWGRIFFVYGPHEAPVRFVPDVIRALLEGRAAECTEGRQRRDFMHAEDVARAFVAVLDSDWRGAVNVASGQCVALADVVHALARLVGRPELVRLGARPTPAGEPARIAADVRVLHERIGFTPRHTLETGLASVVRDWREALGAS